MTVDRIIQSGCALWTFFGNFFHDVVSDFYKTNFQIIPKQIQNTDFESLNVMFGSNRYFEDKSASICWIPEQAYINGSWGFIGGKSFKTNTRYGQLPASELDILNTTQDPIFQTQRNGIDEFKADVADGIYEVYFYWAHLIPKVQKEALAYNLGNTSSYENAENYVFDVLVNGKLSAKGGASLGLIDMVRKMSVVTLFCNITAAIGFAVFALTKSTILKEFGLVAGISIMIIFFISFILLPAVLSYLPAPKAAQTNYLTNKWITTFLFLNLPPIMVSPTLMSSLIISVNCSYCSSVRMISIYDKYYLKQKKFNLSNY